MCSSPGSLLLQKLVFVLDLKLQLCHQAGELKQQSDVTGLHSVALPLTNRGRAGTNVELNFERKEFRNQKTKAYFTQLAD